MFILTTAVKKGGLAAGEEAKCCGICSVLGKGGSQVAEIRLSQEANIFLLILGGSGATFFFPALRLLSMAMNTVFIRQYIFHLMMKFLIGLKL